MAQAFVQRGWLYAALGAAALVAHARRDRWLSALDRRFFRERYDAQRILRDVLTEVRNARSFEDAAPRAIGQIDLALHPQCAAVLVRRPQDAAFHAAGFVGSAPPEIPADSKLMSLVRVLAKPVEIEQSESGWLRRQLPPHETSWLTTSRIEWVFPIALGAERTEALLVLGPKRSEEPYTQEDRDLVEGIASGLALLHERLTPPLSSGVRRSSAGAFLVAPVTERYVVLRELGRGGMGTVYEATDTELDRGVAIKIMRPDLMTSAEAKARFKREARAAAGFSHPNVVTVYDVGVAEDGRAYLVMELLAGTTLRESLRQEGRLPAPRAAAILRGVCAAVEEAHGRHLLHRDLKPENVFLARTAGAEVPKILDFGVAKLLEAPEETAMAGDTTPGQLLGTLAYMSPEQLRGLPPAPSWDVWALGVIAYEMLTGTHPFAGGLQRLTDLEARRVAPTGIHLGPHAPRWDALFARVLSPDVAERPATSREWLTAFEETLAEAV
jgi:serine/threonine-protein kinase